MANIEPCIRSVPDNPCPPRSSNADGPRQVPLILHGQDALHAIANLLGAAQEGSTDASIESDDDSDDEIEQDDDEIDPDDDEGDAGVHVELGDMGSSVDGDDFDEAWPDDPGYIAAGYLDGIGGHSTDTGADVSLEGAFEDLQYTIHDMEGLPSVLSRSRSKRKLCPEHNRPVGHICRPKQQPQSASLQENMVYIPHLGRVEPMPMEARNLIRLLTRPRMMNRIPDGDVKGVAKRHRMLRLYEKDLEMVALREDATGSEREMGVLCPDTLTFAGFSDRSLRPHFRACSRLNMVAHVPELSMVVVASPVGKAMLVTPTQLSTPLACAEGKWKHGLRVEWILPRKSDEMGTANSRRPLHGMAIGPVQDERGVGGRASERASMPRRYRLMLHYQNHDIATYEITREEQTGKLCVF